MKTKLRVTAYDPLEQRRNRAEISTFRVATRSCPRRGLLLGGDVLRLDGAALLAQEPLRHGVPVGETSGSTDINILGPFRRVLKVFRRFV